MAKKYIIEVVRIVTPADQDTLEFTNAVEFVNRGEATAFINNEQIETNQSTTFSGHQDEIDTTRYKVTFKNTGGQTQLVFMKVKRYLI